MTTKRTKKAATPKATANVPTVPGQAAVRLTFKRGEGKDATTKIGHARLILAGDNVNEHGEKDSGNMFVALALPNGGTVNFTLRRNLYSPDTPDLSGVVLELKAVDATRGAATAPAGTIKPASTLAEAIAMAGPEGGKVWAMRALGADAAMAETLVANAVKAKA